MVFDWPRLDHVNISGQLYQEGGILNGAVICRSAFLLKELTIEIIKKKGKRVQLNQAKAAGHTRASLSKKYLI